MEEGHFILHEYKINNTCLQKPFKQLFIAFKCFNVAYNNRTRDGIHTIHSLIIQDMHPQPSSSPFEQTLDGQTILYYMILL